MVCVCMMPVCMYGGTCRGVLHLCVHVYGGQKLTPGVFLNCSPLYSLRQGLRRDKTQVRTSQWVTMNTKDRWLRDEADLKLPVTAS